MFRIFNGQVRGIGEQPTIEVFAQIGVKFRAYLKFLKGAKLSVFMCIALHADKDGWAEPPLALIQKETGYNSHTISDAISDLKGVVIEKTPILLVVQVRENGQFDHNRYLIFPTNEEVKAFSPSVEKPHVEKPSAENNVQSISIHTEEDTSYLPDVKSGTVRSTEGPNTPSSTPIVVDEGCADAQLSVSGSKKKRQKQAAALNKQISALIKTHHDNLPVQFQTTDVLYKAGPYREAATMLIKAGFTEDELAHFVQDTYKESWTADRLLSLGYFARNYPKWRASLLKLRPPTVNPESEQKRIPLSLEDDPFLNGSMYKPVQRNAP